MTAKDPVYRTAPGITGRSIATQRWRHLTFLHWRVETSRIAPLLPAGLQPDEFDGSSWVGLIPFQLDRATLFGSPPVPHVGSFVEVNVRLYAVDASGRRGVVFLSLEASRVLAVLAARATFGLPYFWSRTRIEREGKSFGYDASRIGGGPSSRIRVRVNAPINPGPAAYFLTARWGMFTVRGGRTVYVPNEHEPWELFSASLVDFDDQLVESAGLPGVVDRAPDSVLYSPGVLARFGWPERMHH